MCDTGVVGDEHHFVSVCPALAAVRTHYAPLFVLKSRTLRAFDWQRDLRIVVRYIYGCSQARILNPCVGVPSSQPHPGSYKPSGIPRAWSVTPRVANGGRGNPSFLARSSYSSSGALSALAPNIHRLRWGHHEELGELRRLSRGPEVRPEVSGAATIGQRMSQQG